MTVHARRIASVPRRGPIDTWRAICDLIGAEGDARAELDGIAGIAAALIAEEYTRDDPITVSGTGPQVRIYTLHGDQAIEAETAEELPLSHAPTTGSWALSLPCADDDLVEAEAAVAAAPHVEVRTLGQTAGVAKSAASASPAARPIIDLAALERS